MILTLYRDYLYENLYQMPILYVEIDIMSIWGKICVYMQFSTLNVRICTSSPPTPLVEKNVPKRLYGYQSEEN